MKNDNSTPPPKNTEQAPPVQQQKNQNKDLPPPNIDQFLSTDPICNLHLDNSLDLASQIDYHRSYKNYMSAISSPKNQPSPGHIPQTLAPTTTHPLSVKDPIGSNTNTNPPILQEPTKPRILETAEKLVNDLRSANSKRLEYEAKGILYLQYKRNGVYPKWCVNRYSPELMMNTQALVYQFVEFRKKQASDFLDYAASVYKTHAESKRNDSQWLSKRIMEKYSEASLEEYNINDLWKWVDHLATKDRKHHEKQNQMEYNQIAQYPLQYIWEGVDSNRFTIPIEANPPKPDKQAARANQDGTQNFRSAPQVRRGGRSRSRNRGAAKRPVMNQPSVQPLMSVQVAPPRRQPNNRRPRNQPKAPRNQQAQMPNNAQDPNQLRLLEQNVEISTNILSTMNAINQNLAKMNQ